MLVLSGMAKTARLTRKVFPDVLGLCRAHRGARVKLDWWNWRIVNWSMGPRRAAREHHRILQSLWLHERNAWGFLAVSGGPDSGRTELK
jgi:hypothetical protein